MEEFATLEKVKELFEKVDFIGEENCFIYALTNTQKPAPSGLLGGMVAGMEAALENDAEKTGTIYNMIGNCDLKLGEAKEALNYGQRNPCGLRGGSFKNAHGCF